MQPRPNRIQRNRSDNPLTNCFRLERPITPSIESPADLPGRFQYQFNEPMFLLRGKRRSELRFSAYPEVPSTDLSKSSFAISGPFSLGFRAASQSRHGSGLGQHAKLFWRAPHPFEAPYGFLPTSQATPFHQSSALSESLVALSLESPPVSSERYRPNSGTNLTNSVVVHGYWAVPFRDKMNVVPSPTLDSTATLPPIFSTSCWVM